MEGVVLCRAETPRWGLRHKCSCILQQLSGATSANFCTLTSLQAQKGCRGSGPPHAVSDGAYRHSVVE
eukprot:4605937-Karenia_brevis.AAC.1